MRAHISDAITRRTVDGITRRGSLMTLSGAGLVAVFGGQTTAGAKKNKKKHKNKTKEDPFKLCAPQVEECKTTVTVLNGNAAQLLCCDSFATCDATQFFLCLLNAPV